MMSGQMAFTGGVFFVALRFGNRFVVLYGTGRTRDKFTVTQYSSKGIGGLQDWQMDFSEMKVYGQCVCDDAAPSIDRLVEIIERHWREQEKGQSAEVATLGLLAGARGASPEDEELIQKRLLPGGCYCEETTADGVCKSCGCRVQKIALDLTPTSSCPQDCPYCAGACLLCGAGCWNAELATCDHDQSNRHRALHPASACGSRCVMHAGL